MQDHIKMGVVDFAVFSNSFCLFFIVDCEKDTELTLLTSGKKLSEETVKTPLIAISNYLFNGLREDSISISNGLVSEAYVSVSTDREYFYRKGICLHVGREIVWILKLSAV